MGLGWGWSFGSRRPTEALPRALSFQYGLSDLALGRISNDCKHSDALGLIVVGMI